MRGLRSAAFLLLVPLLGTAQVPPRDQRPAPPAGDSSIAGRVTTAEGRPVARARVLLGSGGQVEVTRVAVTGFGGGARQQVTDANGQFAFAGLPAGSYTLSASHSRYLLAQYGQQFVGQPGRTIELGPGERFRADIVAVRGGAVTGRVFDESGEPLQDVSVQAYRYTLQGKRRQLVPAGGRSYASNDIGQFRVANLPPGEFVIAAQYRGIQDPNQPDATARSGYAPTWYPGTLAPSAAQVLRVMPGTDVHGIDFVLQPTRLVQASGAILSSSGQPVSGVQLIVTPLDGDVVTSSRPATRVYANGQFTVSDLAPGEYILSAQHSTVVRAREQVQRGGEPPRRDVEYGSLRVHIAGEPVDNLSIQLRPGARISVRVQSDMPMPSRMLGLIAESQPGVSQTMSASGDTFTLNAGPGHYRLMLRGLPEGWVVERVTAGARDITVAGLVLTDSAPVDIVLRVSSRGASLTGQAAGGAAQAPQDYTVVVLADSEAERTQAAQGVRLARPDQAGRFQVKGLRGGSYFVAAVDYVDPNEMYDARFWARVEPNAVRLTLGPGEARQIIAPFISRR